MANLGFAKPNSARTAKIRASGSPRTRSKSRSKDKSTTKPNRQSRAVSLQNDRSRYDRPWWEDVLKQSSSPTMKVGNSDRGGWWRGTIKDTPAPGAYTLKDFIQERLGNPVSQTYRFKGEGRMRKPSPDQQPIVNQQVNLGQPREYDSIEKLKSREEPNISPASYNLMMPLLERVQSHNGVFRSSVKRFPTIYFTPKEGPAPGQYDVKYQVISQAITSSFQSKVPRFFVSYSQTPGPMTYSHNTQLSKGSRLSSI
eukprot:gi/632958554/ref/XP_007895102.1/ PREDICTED: uncharacterized protein C2orf61 homolog [Callorhinchus milii]